MDSPAINTMIKIMEMLPEPAQEQLVEHVKAYLDELREEQEWDALVQRTQPGLEEAARRARLQIAEGKARPFTSDEL
jgi:hypothetical protein